MANEAWLWSSRAGCRIARLCGSGEQGCWIAGSDVGQMLAGLPCSVSPVKELPSRWAFLRQSVPLLFCCLGLWAGFGALILRCYGYSISLLAGVARWNSLSSLAWCFADIRMPIVDMQHLCTIARLPRGWYGWFLEEKAARRNAAQQGVEAERLPEDARCNAGWRSRPSRPSQAIENVLRKLSVS